MNLILWKNDTIENECECKLYSVWEKHLSSFIWFESESLYAQFFHIRRHYVENWSCQGVIIIKYVEVKDEKLDHVSSAI